MPQEMAAAVRITMLLFLAFSYEVALGVTENKVEKFHVGVVLDLGTPVGKVARTSISIAVEDFYAVHPNYTTQLVFHVRDSMSDDVQAAAAGKLHARLWTGILLFLHLLFRKFGLLDKK
jgi:ionotropic glutamate receptor